MVTVRQNHIGLYNRVRAKNVRYKTTIPSRVFSCSLSEIYQEIRDNRQGNIVFKNDNGNWVAPIINVEMVHDASFSSLWVLGRGGFTKARCDYKEEMSIAVVGYKDNPTNSPYYDDDCNNLFAFAVYPNEELVNEESSKFGLSIFEDYPEYYEIIKHTDRTFIFRCQEIVKRCALSLYTHPMLLPWEYLMQEFYQGFYVGEKVEEEDGTVAEERLPVVQFWEEVEGQRIPQFYTYEEKSIGRGDYINWVCEVKLKKVNSEKVKQDNSWLFVNKRFLTDDMLLRR